MTEFLGLPMYRGEASDALCKNNGPLKHLLVLPTAAKAVQPGQTLFCFLPSPFLESPQPLTVTSTQGSAGISQLPALCTLSDSGSRVSALYD